MCPVCRSPIGPDDMRLQSEQIEQILNERGRKFDLLQEQRAAEAQKKDGENQV